MACAEPPIVRYRERLRRWLGMFRIRALAFASAASALFVTGVAPSFADQGRTGTPDLAAQPIAARPRMAWTSSQFEGTPDPPPPYTVVPAFPKLKFEFPVVLVPAPGTSRLFLGELKGRIYSFPNEPGCDQG